MERNHRQEFAPALKVPFPSQISERDRAALVQFLEERIRTDLPMGEIPTFQHGVLVGRAQILDLVRNVAFGEPGAEEL